MRGLTLLEVLISFTILSLIIAGIYAVINIADMSWNTETALLELQQEVRLAMDGITREIRQAKPSDITVSNAGARVDFLVPGATETIGYFLAANRIFREHPAGTTKVLAQDVSVLNFCCKGGIDCLDCSSAHALQVSIQAQRTVKGRTMVFPLTGKIMLRNE